MPFCPQCGIDNPAGARYCDQCGAMLIPVPPQPAAPVAPPAAPAPAIGPTVCPQCGQAAIPGEAFCDNCGAPLSAPSRPAAPVTTPPYSAPVAPQASYPPPIPAPAPAAPPATPPHQPPLPTPTTVAPPSYQAPVTPPVSVPATPAGPTPVSGRASLAPAAFVVMGTGAIVPLPATAQAVIGRGDPVSKYFPDIDLSAHGALDQGVGRRHARIFVQGGQILLEDLDSTNGTLVNGQKVAPRQARALADGDQITLGRMLLRFQA
ncbi:MAG: FHA domain-containing protein [Chloroflexi bacterium]|nr:FHA domain-containing protein [Chloroflexota bacterium]